MPRLLSLLLAVIVLVPAALAGCGGEEEGERLGGLPRDEETATGPEPEDVAAQLSEEGPPYNLSEIEALLEQAGLNINRIGLDASQSTGLSAEVDVPLLQEARYQEARTTQKFDLLVFPSEDAAREGIRQLRDTDVVQDDGMIVAGENIVAVADRRFDDEPLSTVQEVLRDVPPNPAHGDGGTTGGG